MNAVLIVALAVVAKEPANLGKGDVVVTTRLIAGSPIPEATTKAVVDAAPEAIWTIISDCANYKTTMPSIEDSKQVFSGPPTAADGENAVEVRNCRVVADLPFPFPDLVSVTRGVHRVVPGKSWQRQWKLVEGDYVVNEGMWLLEPFGDTGDRTLVTYVIHAQPKIFLPDSLVTSIEESRLPEMMKNLRAKAAKVARVAPKAP